MLDEQGLQTLEVPGGIIYDTMEFSYHVLRHFSKDLVTYCMTPLNIMSTLVSCDSTWSFKECSKIY